MTFRRWVLTILSFAATIGVSVYLVFTSWKEGGGFADLPLRAHALALGLVILEVAIRAAKIAMSARSFDIPLSFGTAVRTSLAGDFGSAITPARSGAEPARFLVLRESGLSLGPALLILFTELFLEMLSIAVVAVVLAFVYRDSGRMLTGLVSLVGGYALFVLGAGAIALFLSRRNASGPEPAWALRLRISGGRWRRVQKWLVQVRANTDAVRRAHLPTMFAALLFSIGHVLCRVAVLPALVLSMRSDVALAPLMLWPLALFYGGVVSPAPGGGGIIEVAFKAALGHTIPASIFAASLVWWRFYTFYLYILLGGWAAGSTALRAIRDGDEPDDTDDTDTTA